MQDIQSIGNGVGSFFPGGERRVMAANYHQGSLKCPRCGSLNTKFCYYNNYNLSQPRFFCKACRRYWTKGGVLRNVPVGGGSRKTKRSKQKSGNKTPSSVSVNISPETKPFTPTEALRTSVNQSFEPPMLTDNHRLFSEIGTFRSSDELPLGFISAPEVSSSTQQRDQDEVLEKQNWEIDSLGFVDQKRSEVEYSQPSNGGAAAEDWGLFDQSYWFSNPDYQLNYFLTPPG